MPREKTLQHISRFIWWAFVFCAMGISSCNPFSTSASTSMPECEPQYHMNIYNPTPVPPTPITTLTPSSTPTAPPVLTPKQTAYRNFVHEVERWTDAQTTITVGESNRVRITITFLSPELLRSASIVDSLDRDPANPYIEAEAVRHLEEVAAKEKLLFFISIFPILPLGETSANHIVQLDGNDLRIENTSGFQIAPIEHDPNIDQPIHPSQFTHGYLYYPFAVSTSTGCSEVLDSTFNTKIIIETDNILVDNASLPPHSWTIQYTYLLNTSGSHLPDDNPPAPDDSEIKSSDTPPESVETSPAFWQEYARFLWGMLTPAY